MPLFIPDDERERYNKDYAEYVRRFEDYQREYRNWLRLQAPMMAGAMGGVQLNTNVLPLEEHEERAHRGTGRTQLATVANIGLTMRVLDVLTGEVVWVGQGAKRHMQTQEGLQILTQHLIDDLLK
jgi:hypothetical protein